MTKQFSLFIGRWQPLHEGHKYIFNERLRLGKNVCIAIRDVESNENQPWTAEEIKQNIEKEYQELITEGRVKVIVVPDIESVNYGRGVGYEIIEHIVPENISEISATKIREQLRKDGYLKTKGTTKEKSTLIRHILKTISYRFLGTLTTVVIAFSLGATIETSTLLGIGELLIKPILYFLHERVWYKKIRINENHGR
jgi:uncharacterized membrane protein/phosphopantetheine adenylyltransferase